MSRSWSAAPIAETHLTDDELDEILIALPAGESFAEAADDVNSARPLPVLHAHLTDCVLCQQRLNDFAAPVSAFNDATRRWSEARSNTVTRDLSLALAESQSWPRAWTARMQWLAPMTAALLVVAVMTAVPGGMSGRVPASTQPDEAPARTLQAVSTAGVSPVATENQPAVVKAAPHLVETAAAAPVRIADAAEQADIHHSHDNKQLASDNAILLAIDSAIAPAEPAPDEFYRSVGGGSGLNKIASGQVND